MFWKGWKEEDFQEKDFRIIHELGFNFVRLCSAAIINADDFVDDFFPS
jgi:hypothetical protein